MTQQYTDSGFLTDQKVVVFLNAVRAMREKQKAYFKTRDRAIMLECVSLEKEIDKMLVEFSKTEKETP